jgi:hypothetical protein
MNNFKVYNFENDLQNVMQFLRLKLELILSPLFLFCKEWVQIPLKNLVITLA